MIRDRICKHIGTNTVKIKDSKRKNVNIVTLCDELFSEEKSTDPKVQTGFRRNGFSVSPSTVYRIARDLMYQWTKP